MQQYLRICRELLENGKRKSNRTGIDHIGYHGDMMKFDLADGFPAVTTKKLYVRQVFAEMLGFLRGYDNAADFRGLGCKVWDANANENDGWLANRNRKGEDDLGRIYGVQARDWKGCEEELDCESDQNLRETSIDQLRNVYNDLKAGIDNRREIVIHWNPAELEQMALPPCHLMYQFGLEPLTVKERLSLLGKNDLFNDAVLARVSNEGEEKVMEEMDSSNRNIPRHRLNLSMYQRSCDVPLGIPFNIAGYAWLLSVMAQITNTVPGVFTHFMHDIHYYANQEEGLIEQVKRQPLNLPTLKINPKVKTLEDLETWVTVDDFELIGYEHHPAIKFPFAV